MATMPYFRLTWLSELNMLALTKMSETVPGSAQPIHAPKPSADKSYPDPSLSQSVPFTDLHVVKRQTRPAEPRCIPKPRAIPTVLRLPRAIRDSRFHAIE